MLFSIFKHQTRITDLEDKVRGLESDMKALDAEWSSVYDQVRRTLAKIAKRDQRDGEKAQEPPGSTTHLEPDASGLSIDERIRQSRRGNR